VLGAGYDLLCLRLAPEFPEVRFLEVDHPPTARAKQRGLLALHAPGNVGSIPVDLQEHSLRKVLDEAGWDQSAVSLVCAEGLTQYLPEQAVRELLAEVALVTGPRSAFALTFVGWRKDENRPEAGPKTDRTLARFAKRGEPWLWGCDPSRLEHFLANGPWVVAVPPSAAGMDHLVELELSS
jgi:methyltransferase (TIGR00027 family)